MNLYNKYRPRTFEEMVGNETAIQTMGKAIKKPNHSHTYLLSGPPGTGKTTIARIMATMLGASDMDIREINTASARGIDTAREIIQQMRLNPMFGKTIVYILDECFYGETLISTPTGNIPINKIKIGDSIINAFGVDSVKNIFVNKVPLNRICRIKINGNWIYTTIDHLFFTQRGWIKVKDINERDYIFNIKCDIMESNEGVSNGKRKKIQKQMQCMWKNISGCIIKSAILLSILQNDIRESSKENARIRTYLQRMWKDFYQLWETKCLFKKLCSKDKKSKSRISKKDIYGAIKEKTFGSADQIHKETSRISGAIIRTHEEKQSGSKSRNTEKNKGNNDSKRNIRKSIEGESEGERILYRSTTIASQIHRWKIRISNIIRKTADRLSYLLQSRYRISKVSSCNRSRWKWASSEKEKNTRYKKGKKISAIRLESIEIFQQGCINESEWSGITSKDILRGFVEYYDLEVEWHSSYCVNGIIVHNCHKFTNDMQNALLKPLEDTPEHVYFFLCTTDPNKLIAAIKSRCTAIKTVLLKPEQLTIIIKRVAKLENIKLTGEMIELIADHAKGSPRKALVELERIAVLESEKERKDFIEGDSVDEEDADVSKLFGVLLRNKSGWVEVADVLKLLSENGKMDNADDIRYAIMGMANSMLLNGKMVKRNAIILEAFSDVNYNSGKFGLTLACLRVTIPG
jgi:DNA polymerase III gamma/tau subunit